MGLRLRIPEGLNPKTRNPKPQARSFKPSNRLALDGMASVLGSRLRPLNSQPEGSQNSDLSGLGVEGIGMRVEGSGVEGIGMRV